MAERYQIPMKARLFYPLFTMLLLCSCSGEHSRPLPILENHGSHATLVVDGKPMLIIGGELGNSSASSPEDLARIFPHLERLGLNTVLVPLSWELIEPEEDRFDFSILDGILFRAREHDLRVVLLWFGAWKNSMSCYAPEWFKKDTGRFPRAILPDGSPVEEACALSPTVLQADRKAFCRVMEYLRDNDRQHTVVMVQVENEMGMINVPRDYCPIADSLYHSPVPQELVSYLESHRESLHPHIAGRMGESGEGLSWPQFFGDDIYAEEIFQTWTYARYTGELARAGKEILNLPMYVNVALDSRGRLPGQYPSGGPLAQLKDIWHCAAPSIDVLGVDIYDSGVTGWMERYHLADNPLFIPEIRLEDKAAHYALYAYGHHDAMGFCPFSIEDCPLLAGDSGNDWRNTDMSADDQLNAYTRVTDRLSPIASAYSLMNSIEELVLARQGSDDMDAVLLDDGHREASILTPDGIKVHVNHDFSLGWDPRSKEGHWPEASCMLLRLGEYDYLLAGSGTVLTFSAEDSSKVGIAYCAEVDVKDGEITEIRRLNGDQTHQGRHIRIPCGTFRLQRFRLYTY